MAFWHKLLGGESTDDSFDEIKQNLNEAKAVMLDVRGQDERDAVHLKDSIFVPISEIKSLEAGATELGGLPKNKIVYCH